MGKTLLALCTPKRFSLSPGLSDEQRIDWTQYVYCIRSIGTVFHKRSAACYYCCEQCNTWTHNCPGCGEPVIHGIIACDSCEAELMMYNPGPNGIW
jgi:hypothetical protein